MEPPKSIAVALPPGKFFDQLYQSVFSPWADEHHLALTRVDLTAGKAGAICGAVENVDCLIADISARHPRVLYVAGYAHGIGKRVVFIAQFPDDFLFDSGNQTCLAYSGNPQFLRSELNAFLSGQRKTTAKGFVGPREKFLELFGAILSEHQHEHRGQIEMENEQTFVLLGQDMDLPLVQDLSRRARELGLRLKLM